MTYPPRRYRVTMSETWESTYEVEGGTAKDAPARCDLSTGTPTNRTTHKLISTDLQEARVEFLPPEGPTYPPSEHGLCYRMEDPAISGFLLYVKGGERYLRYEKGMIDGRFTLNRARRDHRNVLARMAWGDGTTVTPAGIAHELPFAAELLDTWAEAARKRANEAPQEGK